MEDRQTGEANLHERPRHRYGKNDKKQLGQTNGHDKIIHISLEHVNWVGSAKEAAEKAIAEAGDIRKLIKIIVDVKSVEEAVSLLDLKIDYVFCHGFSEEDIRSLGKSSKGWLQIIIDESIPLEEAKTLKDLGVRLYALDLSAITNKKSTLKINFTQ